MVARKYPAVTFETRMVSSAQLYKEEKLTDRTVLATQAIANVVKSSFGPSGLDKMMVDDIGVSFSCLEKYAELLTCFRMSRLPTMAQRSSVY